MTPFPPPPSSHSGLQYSSFLRPGRYGLPPGHQSELLRQSRAVATPHAKRLGELMKEEMTIREKLLHSEPLQPSSYDTAWVAMVPAPGCPQASRFPQCVDWIMQNQRHDGTWGLGLGLVKDALSSTLACVLALKTWGIGEDKAARGLLFIQHNLSSVMMDDDGCDGPVGFNLIFPGMLARCIAMGLEMPLTQAHVDAIFQLRDKELRSMASGCTAFMVYVAEGLGDLQLLDWNQAIAYQRKNGSFFNSPSTTAAAAIHNGNGRALEYLDSVTSMLGNSVPTVYPRNFYTRLRMVDALEKAGISRSFSDEINSIIDMTYSSWLSNDEEITLDITTCAMAFRLLRMHGYDVSSDGLAQLSEESAFHNSIHGCLNDTEALLELHKASHLQIRQQETILPNIGSWSAKLLKQQLCSNKISRNIDPAEVEHVLKHPFYTTLDRLERRSNIEHVRTMGVQVLKSAYRVCVPDEEIAALAAADFQSSRTLYKEEVQCLESWVKGLKLEELKFARKMPLIRFFPLGASLFPCELSEARITMGKNSLLVTIVDDLFDVGASREEMENLVELIQRWDEHDQVGFCSERVEIVFRAIYDTCNDLAAKATAIQNRSVIDHLAELDLRTSAAPARVITKPLVALVSSASEIQLESLYPSTTGGYPE